MKPFLKWVGGKHSLLPQLIPLLPDMAEVHTYVEPFVGSGALFFALEFDAGDRVVLGDLNGELVNVYRALRDTPVHTSLLLSDLATLHKHDQVASYKAARDRFNGNEVRPPHRASLFLYLNRTCFNGVYRVNGDGKFNVPLGDYKDPVIFDAERMRAATEHLVRSAVTLKTGDFAVIVRDELCETKNPKKFFAYLDPPYVPVSATANFTGYTADKFGAQDLRRLVHVCEMIDKEGGLFMVSNSDHAAVRAAFDGYNIHEVSRRGSINSDSNKRGAVRELVITNY